MDLHLLALYTNPNSSIGDGNNGSHWTASLWTVPRPSNGTLLSALSPKMGKSLHCRLLKALHISKKWDGSVNRINNDDVSSEIGCSPSKSLVCGSELLMLFNTLQFLRSSTILKIKKAISLPLQEVEWQRWDTSG